MDFPSVYFGRTLHCYIKRALSQLAIAIGSQTSHVENSTSHFAAAELALAQVLEQKLCNTPEVGSSRLGYTWQFYEGRVRNRIWSTVHLHT